MSERPLLFLDVDGVLNCIDGGHSAERTVGGFHVEIPDGVGRRVGRLARELEPVWATAWLGSAHTEWKGLLGITGPSWPYLYYPDLKLPAILQYAAARPFIWIDDDAEWELAELGCSPLVNGLAINPDPRIGLTDKHVNEALEWARMVGQPQ